MVLLGRLRRQRLQVFHIHPGAKRRALGGHNQHLRGGLLHLPERRQKFLDQCMTDGVALGRPAQGQRRNPAFIRQLQCLIHGGQSLPLRTSTAQTAAQCPHSSVAHSPMAFGSAPARRALAAGAPPPRSAGCPPAHPAQTDIPPARPAPNRSAGSPLRRPPQPWPPRFPCFRAGARPPRCRRTRPPPPPSPLPPSPATPPPPCLPAKPSESPGRRYSAPPAAPHPRPSGRHTDCQTPSKRRPPCLVRCLRPCATPPPAPRCSLPPTGS